MRVPKSRYQRPFWRFWMTNQEKKAALYQEGFSWAATELLKGTKQEKIWKWIECSFIMGDYDEFDDGARDAATAFCNRD